MILLDTHAVLWLLSDPPRLSTKARLAIAEARDAGEGLLVADITLWEIALLAKRGRLELGIGLADLLGDVERRFVVRPITSPVCLKALELPANYPKDPADRLIGATALVETAGLVTADEAIRRSRAVQTIW